MGSGLNAKRRKSLALLADPTVTTIVVEHRDRFARFARSTSASLAANGRQLVVVGDAQVDDDLVRDMTEVLTSFSLAPTAVVALTEQPRRSQQPESVDGA